MNSKKIEQTITIPEHLAGKRLDQALSWIWPFYSRTRIKNWLLNKEILVNNEKKRPRDLVSGGELVVLSAEILPNESWEAEDIPLQILHADEDIIVVNKPAGLVVHPAETTPSGTLVNGLLSYYPELAQLPRAGIVHRLDKDTTGVLVVARGPEAHHHLVKQIQARSMGRRYEAIVNGVMTAGRTIDAPISRNPNNRFKMAVVESGKPAVTHYRVLERFQAHTHVRVKLETGRTHQIRVHMAHIGYPLIGDPVYGGRPKLPKNANDSLKSYLQQFKRQALHARELHLIHPRTEQAQVFSAPVPDDMIELVELLRQHHENYSA